MAATMLPALPDEAQFDHGPRPDWRALHAALEGVTGKELVALGDLGELTLADLTDAYAKVKRYQDEFLERYWQGPYGAVEKAGTSFRDHIRLPETKRCEDFLKAVREIQSEVKAEVDRLAAAEKRRLEEEQRRAAEEEKRRELERLEAERQAAMEQAQPDEAVAELDAHIEAVQAEPVIPAAVNEKQVAQALFKAPAKVSGRTVYDRVITNWPAFLKWLIANPAWITSLKLTANFTAMKSNNVEIPGVKLTSRVEVSNRARS